MADSAGPRQGAHGDFFTVHCLKSAGLGDQLGTQFDRLARLGRALGYRYVHTPPTFPRSIASSGISHVLSRVITAMGHRPTHRADPLTEFLGLARWTRNVSDVEFTGIEPTDIDLPSILSGLPADAALAHVKSRLPPATGRRLVRLTWSAPLYACIPTIDRLLQTTPKSLAPELNLAACYWAQRNARTARPPLDSSRPRLVVHLRLGDSAEVELAGRRLFVLGDEVMIAGNPGGLPAVDENRRAVGIGEYRDVLTAMIGRLSKEDLSPTLISDGYERTYHVLRRAMQRGHPLLHGVTDRELADSQRSAHATLEEDLASLLNWARIVGETDRKLYQSIDALACADIVVWGTGGFAHYVHQLFRPPGARSATVHVREGSEAAVAKVQEFMNERRSALNRGCSETTAADAKGA